MSEMKPCPYCKHQPITKISDKTGETLYTCAGSLGVAWFTLDEWNNCIAELEIDPRWMVVSNRKRARRIPITCKDCGDVLFQIYGAVYFCPTCGMGQVVDSQLDLQAALDAVYQERASNGGKS